MAHLAVIQFGISKLLSVIKEQKQGIFEAR